MELVALTFSIDPASVASGVLFLLNLGLELERVLCHSISDCRLIPLPPLNRVDKSWWSSSAGDG